MLNYIKQEITYYKQKVPELKDLLEFYWGVFRAQNDFAVRIAPLSSIDLDEATQALEARKPVLKSKGMTVDSTLFRRLAGELSSVIGRRSKAPLCLDKVLADEEFGSREFIAKAESGEVEYLVKFCARLGLNKDIVFFLVHNSLIPFYQRWADEVSKELDYSSWREGLCPVCGHRPQASKIVKRDSTKVLGCVLCRTEWEFDEVKCPYCSNTRKEDFNCFCVEGDEGHLAEACNACRRYIKTSDEEKLNREVAIPVEDVVTVALDTVAKERNYTPGAHYLEQEI